MTRVAQKTPFRTFLILATLTTTGWSLTGCNDEGSVQTPTPTPSSTEQATTGKTDVKEVAGSTPTTPTTTQQAPKRTGGAMLYMENPRVDFGPVADYETRTAKIRFVNTGDQVLDVSRVQPTCGCTTTALTQKLFAPGEGTEIELTFKPKGSGKQTKLVKVHTNDPINPVQTIEIKADVTATVSANPKSLSFGLIPLNAGGSGKVTIMAQNDNYEPTQVVISGQLKQYAESVITQTTPPGAKKRSWTINVTTKPNIPWGWHTGSLLIKGDTKIPSTGETRPHSLTVGMNANVQGDLRASDSMFRLMILNTDQQFTKKVRLSRADGTPFTIQSATVKNGRPANMAVAIVPDSKSNGSAYELILSGTTGSTNSSVLGQVDVVTDIPGEEEISLRIAGSIRKR